MSIVSLKILFLSFIFGAMVSGCSTHRATQPTGPWTQVNKVDASNKVIRVQNSTIPISIALEKAIEQFVPTLYRLEIDPDVDLKTIIVYDNSKNWLEALAQGMSEASIEFVANLYKKSGTIKRSKQTLAEVIETALPHEYTAFSDASLNQQSLLHFDQRKHWIDALNNGTAEIGIDLKIDFTQKMIFLKPTNHYNSHNLLSNN